MECALLAEALGCWLSAHGCLNKTGAVPIESEAGCKCPAD
jgi:hypothetical protein